MTLTKVVRRLDQCVMRLANDRCHIKAVALGEHLRAGRLVPVLEAHWPAPEPVQIVFPHGRLLAARVRAFVDWSATILAPELARLSAH